VNTEAKQQKTALSQQKQVSRQAEPMTPSRKSRTPKLRHHKATGQAYAVLNGQAIYFGPFGTDEATERYHKTIAEWLANGRLPEKSPTEITINELVARYWVFAESYYAQIPGKNTELNNMQLSLRMLCELYGNTRILDFGPRGLKTIRQKMVEKGWCRNHVNQSINRIKRIFKWATAEELIPASVYHALWAVASLKQGRCDARESEPVRPVPQEYVDAIQPYVSRQVWAIIQLQLLTAARPGEILQMRPGDIDRSGKIWIYRPVEHKTAHHGHPRQIYIGPRAQEFLQPFLLRPADAYCFSPAEADAARRIKRTQDRKTPLSYGNIPGSHCTDNPIRTKGDVYTVATYRRAITRAVERAFPAPAHLAKLPNETGKQWHTRLGKKGKAELKAWYKQYHWHPHQLRHNAATFLRKEFGLETARIILGHRSAVITEIYAEQDQRKALEVIMRVG